MSQWRRIYTYLKNHGVNVYSPGQHQGECTEPYVVLKDAGVNQLGNFSSEQALYDVMCYVPQQKFSTLEPYVDEVKKVLTGMFPELIPTHFQTTSFLDDTVKGHMISVQYRSSRKFYEGGMKHGQS